MPPPSRPPRSLSLRLQRRWLQALTLLLLAGAFPLTAGADDCDDTRAALRSELAMRFASPDDPAVLERRDRIQALFVSTTPDCAEALYEELGPEDDGTELSHAFHYALATPTRKQLREILQAKYAFLREIQAAAGKLSDPDERREIVCWLDKMGAGADDRVIQWNTVEESGDELMPLIHEPGDVGAIQPEDHALFTFLGAVVDLSVIDQSGAKELQNVREGTWEAIDQLDELAGPASDPPPHLAAIRVWIEQQRSNSRSVLSCL